MSAIIEYSPEEQLRHYVELNSIELHKQAMDFEKEFFGKGLSSDQVMATYTAFSKAHKYGIPYSTEIVTVLPPDYHEAPVVCIAGCINNIHFTAIKEDVC